MIVLFAALIAPFFINWDSYRANFEHEAARILGHPVHVGGAAHVSILPSPSVTFTDVEVGDPGAPPLMTIAQFSATFELVPLLQGQFHVVTMHLEKPQVVVSADGTGAVDWLQRAASAQNLDPDKVVLGDVRIDDGSLAYSDARTGVALAFDDIDANVSASSLAGPWRVDGRYLKDGTAVPFRFSTGRRLDNGTIRFQAEVSPAEAPVSITTDGSLAISADAGITYTGTYSFAGANDVPAAPAASDATDAGSAAPASSGWRSDGSFTLSRDRLVIDKAVLSGGPADHPTSIAGSLTVGFGAGARFDATGTASQLDLDTALGGGPSAPINVADAATGFVSWLTALPVPPIPGRVAFDVPAIVVGGSVIQGVDVAVEPGAAGWKIEGLTAQLPGQAHIEADGVLSTGRSVGFVGSARLAVAQPAAFAAWWRGAGQPASGRTLSSFDIAGNVDIAAGRIAVDKIAARIGDASISGQFAWDESGRDHSRHLGTDLKADRIDFDEVRALAGLIAGHDLTDIGGLADSYSIRLAADELRYDDIVLKGVTVDAGYADDVLNVVQLAVGDLGGASFRVTSGRIDGLTTSPRGHLDARLEATTFDGLSAIAAKFLPDSGLAEWLARTAPALQPAYLDARITGPPKTGGTGVEVALDGVAGQTTFNATVDSAAEKLADWRTAPASLGVTLDSPDSAALAHQFGLAAAAVDNDPGAHVAVSGKGVPADGLVATIDTSLAGLTVGGNGKLAFGADFVPAFAGDFTAKADDLAPFSSIASLTVPGAPGAPLSASGTISTAGTAASFAWQNGTVAGHTVGGKITLARAADASWHIDGGLSVDAVDLGWLASLSLGSPPVPTGNAKAPWPKTAFVAPTYGPVSGKLEVAADHLAVGTLDVTGGTLALALAPQRIDIDVKGGHLAGGAFGGGASIQNVDGNAHVTGQFNLTGAALDAFAWQRDGRVVATGGLDLSANFEATGRSAAGLVSSMTGGGVIAVHNGVALYVNPGTASAIVRISDLGEPLSEDALRTAVEGQIDGDSFAFGETGGAFSIASGTVRATGLSARNDVLAASGNAAIDLNALTLDSDWTLTFPIADAAADAGDASIGLVFRGPLAAPTRIVDAVPFNAYLNARQAARMLDVIATEEADRAEHQRFVQQIAKIKDDEAAAERARQQALLAAQRRDEAAANAVLRIASLHVDREIAADNQLTASLTHAADLAAAAQSAADATAATLAADAAAKAATADAAAASLRQAIAAEDTTAAEVAKTAAQLTQAQETATATAATARNSETAAEAAEKTAAAAGDAEAVALAAAGKTAEDAVGLQAALDTANANLASARAAATAAATDAAKANDAVSAAGADLDAATKAQNAAADAYSARGTRSSPPRPLPTMLRGRGQGGANGGRSRRGAGAACARRNRRDK